MIYEKNIPPKLIRNQAEKYLKLNPNKTVITKTILAITALGGLVFIGALAPGIIKAIRPFYRHSKDGYGSLNPSSIKSALSRFKRHGYIAVKYEKNGKTSIFLTDKGKRYVYDFTHTPYIKKPLIWDRKWRVVIFDIPVRKRRERDIFGNKIKAMGFRQVQKSVWVHPYKCEDEIFFLAKQLRIVNNIEVLTVQKLIHD